MKVLGNRLATAASVLALLGHGATTTAQCPGKILPAALPDHFGFAVDLQQDVGVVGVGNLSNMLGEVGVYARVDAGVVGHPADDAWLRLQTLTPPIEELNDRFGEAVAMDQDLVVVGAHKRGTLGADLGAAFVFARDDAGTVGDPLDDTWTFVAELSGAAAADGGRFGRAVAVSDGTVVVAEPWSGPGYAYVFERDDAGTPGDPLDDTWVETARLSTTDAEDSDCFGSWVAVEDDVLVVGIEDDDVLVGSAAVFLRDDRGTQSRLDDTWIEVQRLRGSTAGSQFHVGKCVAVSGSTIVVGSWTGNEAYVFERDDVGTGDPLDDLWVETAVLRGIAGGGQVRFGSRLDLDGDVLVVGDEVGEGVVVDGGLAHVFRRDDGGTPGDRLDDMWVPSGTVGAWGADGGHLGSAVAVSGETALLGAVLDDERGDEAGAVYAVALQPGLACAAPRQGSFANAPILTPATLPRLGETFELEVDTSGHLGAWASLLLGYDALVPGLATAFGELLVAPEGLGGALVLAELELVFGPTVRHSVPVPDDPALVGLLVHVQAAVFGGGTIELGNAVDAVAGS